MSAGRDRKTPAKKRATKSRGTKKLEACLASLGQVELKDRCRSLGLPIYGTVKVLRDRLSMHLAACGGATQQEHQPTRELAEVRRLVKALTPNEIRHAFIAACRTHADVFAKLKDKVEPSPSSTQVAKFKAEAWRKKGSQIIKGPNKNSGKWRRGRQVATRTVAEALRYQFNGKPATAFEALINFLEGFTWNNQLPRHHYPNFEVWCWRSEDCEDMWNTIVTALLKLLMEEPELGLDTDFTERLERVNNFCSDYGAMELEQVVSVFKI